MHVIERFHSLQDSPAFLGRLSETYASMNQAYDHAAEHYGFSCRGCDDNCCTQRFYHHTVAEFLYLHEGLKRAEKPLAGDIIAKAKEVVAACQMDTGELLPLMCPVNFGGLCSLYAYRPMICRLHGLPHVFRRPDGKTEHGGGCHRFEALHKATVRVDRTGGYTGLAMLERELRVRIGFAGRYKKTTAQMLMDMAGHLDLAQDG